MTQKLDKTPIEENARIIADSMTDIEYADLCKKWFNRASAKDYIEYLGVAYPYMIRTVTRALEMYEEKMDD